jgi:hypothetical protein
MILLRVLAWLGLPTWIAPLIIAGMLAAGLSGAYIKGRMDSAANCREAALLAQIKAMERDRDAAKAAEALAQKKAADLSAEAKKREEEVTAYEVELKKRADRCDLTPADIDRLRLNQPKSKHR